MKKVYLFLLVFCLAWRGYGQTITTIAGTGSSSLSGDGGAATAAGIGDAYSVAVDTAGNIYMFSGSNNTRIRKISTSGVITNFAGSGATSTSATYGDGGAATAARFAAGDIACDRSGNLYIATRSNVIRKVNASGVISTIAGTGSSGYSGDGSAATAATFCYITSIALDGTGNLYVGDNLNRNVRKINTSGIISTIAGNTYDSTTIYRDSIPSGVAATAVNLSSVFAVRPDNNGNVFISGGSGGGAKIFKLNASGQLSIYAGNRTTTSMQNGVAATTESIKSCYGLAVDAAGTVYISEYRGHVIRKIDASGIIRIVVDTSATAGFSGDGGAAVSAKLNNPLGICFDKSGNLLIADAGNYRIRKVACTAPPAAISGAEFVCANATTTYTNSTSGGAWSSSDPSIATISSSGVITGISSGIATISYTVSSSCGSGTATKNLTVQALPNPTITASRTSVCLGLSDTFSSAEPLCSGNALVFSSTSSSYARGSVVSTATNNITMEAWVKWNGAISGRNQMIMLNGSSWLNGYGLAVQSGSSTLSILVAGVAWLTTSATLTSGTWQHVAVVRRSGTWEVYVNGTSYSVTSATTTPNTPNGRFFVGNDSTVNNFNGTIDDVKFWTTARTSTEIASDRISCYTTQQSALAGYWKFDEGSGSTAADASGNGRTLTLNNTSWTTSAISLNTYAWSFGDGSSSTVSPAVRTYTATGTYTPTLTVTNAYGCTASATKAVNVASSATTATISGASSVCEGATTAFTPSVLGGTWSSSNTSVATVDASGMVTAVYRGTVYSPSATITYTQSYGGACGTTTATKSITSNPLPMGSTFTPTGGLCVGGAMSLGYTGGFGSRSFSSSDTTKVRVSAAGTAYGIHFGSATITATTSNSCGSVSNSMEIYSDSVHIDSITGPSSVCLGSTISLSSATTGGNWVSRYGSYASEGVDAYDDYAAISSTGNVTGLSAGTTIITYTKIGDYGCEAMRTYAVTIAGSPSAGTISDDGYGDDLAPCSYHNFSSSGTPGGVWSVANMDASVTETASIDASTGLLWGYPGATLKITYAVANSCGADTATREWVNFRPEPAAPTLEADYGNVCLGGTVAINVTTSYPYAHFDVYNDRYGGDATVDASGVVTGVSAGEVDILVYYPRVDGDCSQGQTIYTATVIGSDPVTVSGTSTVCTGDATTVSASLSSWDFGHAAWSTSNPAIASVDAYGSVYGVGAGTAEISILGYFYGCLRYYGSTTIGVTGPASLATITGASTATVGSTSALSSSVAMGTWSTSDPSIASVDTNGTITAVALGTAVISFTSTSDCGSVTATHPFLVSPTYCVPNFDAGACAASNSIDSFVMIGEPGQFLHDDQACDTNTYHDRTSLNIHMKRGGTYASTIYTGSGPYSSMDAQVWIDFNDNGTFEGSETVGGQNAYYHEGNFNISIPGDAAFGLHRMRLMSDWYYYSYNVYPYFDPCTDPGTYGATRDYLVTIDTGCAAMAISAIVGDSALCQGNGTTLTCATTGGTWLTGDAAIASINSTSGEVTAIAAGTTTITYDMSTSSCTYQVYHNFTTNALPVADDLDFDYSGRYYEVRPTMCVGGSMYLSIDHGYGTQTITTDSNISFYPAGAGGYMLPLSAGVGVITITRSTACADSVSRAIVTINPLPEAGTASGTSRICAGTTTNISASGETGGTWMSSDASIATVDAATGVVTGVARGTATIAYVVTNGCGADTASVNVTIDTNPDAGAIYGADALCPHTTEYYTSSGDAGGYWYTNTRSSLASINSTTGETYVAVENLWFTVYYEVTNTCGVSTASLDIYPRHSLEFATGLPKLDTICVGSTLDFYPWDSRVYLDGAYTLSDYYADDSAIASVSSSGMITGLTPGRVFISVHIESECGGSTDGGYVTVLPAAYAGNISGDSAVCVGSTTTLTTSGSDGTWSTSNASVASVDSAGVVTALSSGTAMISYTASNARCSETATHSVTVAPCYCTPIVRGAFNSCFYYGDYIHQNLITGENGTRIGDYTGCNGVGYQDFTSSTVTLSLGRTYLDTMNAGSSSMNSQTWIDFNDNGTFESSEVVGGANEQSSPFTYSLVIPSGASTGNHRMRTIVTSPYNMDYYPGMNPCGEFYGGEVRDYTVNVVDCNAPIISGSGTAYVGNTSTLTSSVAGGTWSTSDASIASVDASGTVTAVALGSATISLTRTTSCGDLTATYAFLVSPTYCIPNFDGGACAASNSIDSFMVNGEHGAYLHDDAACDTNTYHDRTSLNVHMRQGGTYASTIYTGSGPYSYMDAQVWIDFNDNGTFEGSETVGGQNAYYHEGNFNVSIPNGSAVGVHRMRLMSDWLYYSYNFYPYFDPCTNPGTYGATRDYLVTIDTGCAAMAISAIEGGSTLCLGTSTSLTDATTGGTWITGDAAIASVNSATGEVIGVAAGNTTITYDMSTEGCTYQVYHNISMNPIPVPDDLDYDYSGRYREVRPTMCVGGSMYLSIAHGYGTQTITMDPNIGFYPAGDGGYMLPLSAGVGVITITRSTACGDSVSRAIVTINPSPAALAVSSEVKCSGSADSFTIGAPFCNTSAVGFTHDSNSIAATSVITTALDNITIEAWVNWSGNISTHQLIVMNGNSFSDGYGLLIAPGGYLVGICGGVSYLSTPFVLTPGKWQHVALVRNSGVWSVYLDGVQGAVSPSTVTPNTPTTGFFVGNSGLGGVGFDGQISHVKFWTSARSSSSVVHDMKSCTASGSDLAAYWSFNENTGDTAFDASGNDRYLELAHATRESVGSAAYSYSWNFGDGATESGMSAVHTFTAPGVYINTLTTTTSAGCTASSVDSVTIVAFPVATITGATNLYPGATVALGITGDAGGTWSSSDAGIATVDSTTGVVTSVTTGIATISYTLTNICGSVVDTAVLPSYCIPNFDGGACAASNSIDSFMVNGEHGDYLHDDAACDTNTYHDRTSLNVHMRQGGTYASTIYTGSGPYSYMDAQVWIDFNDNGTFEGSETVGGQNAYYHEGNFNVSIPNGSAVGVHRMRLMSDWLYYSYNFYPYFDPCTNPGTYGATRDYLVTIDTGCAAMAISAIEGSSTVCAGTSTTLTNATTGGAWITGDATIASVNGSTGEVIGVAAGSTTITYDMSTEGCTYQVYHNITTNPAPVADLLGTASAGPSHELYPTMCVGGSDYLSIGLGYGTQTITTDSNIYFYPAGSGGYMLPLNAGVGVITITRSTACGDSVSRAIVTINPLPVAGTISGASSIAAGTSTTYSVTGGGPGLWSNTATSRATIDTITGVLNSFGVGTDTLRYTVTNSCGTAVARYPVTYTASAGTISGASSVCVGSTITLASTVIGGTWTSSMSSRASVTSTTGVVRGVSAGTVTITYAVGTARAYYSVTIVASGVGAITGGSTTICPGATMTLASSTTGGTWTNAQASRSTVSTTGVVTAIASGSDTIYYTVVNACGTSVARKIITVTGPSMPLGISGSSAAICPGATRANTNATAGGTWSLAGTGIATLSATTGSSVTVTGLAGGIDTLKYTITNSCGLTGTVTSLVTVNPAAYAAPIAGPTSVFTSSSITLTNSVAGGVWSHTAPTVATLSTTGVVYGLTAGVDTVKYRVTNSCGSATAIKVVTVSVAVVSAGSLSGPASVCVGGTATLASTVSGGTWTSSMSSIASINSATGVVTGVSAGSVTITYTYLTARAIYPLTVVNSGVAAIAGGSATMCPGTTMSLSNTTVGGVWSSSVAGRTTVSAMGIVTALASGVDTIKYTVTNACGTFEARKYITVTSPSLPLAISGSTAAICPGATRTNTDGTTGGTWSLSGTGIATITPSGTTVVVTGLAGGVDTLKYSITNSCGLVGTVRSVVTVNPAANAGTISGPTSVGIGGSITLTNTGASGTGTWSNAFTTISSVSTAGVVRGRAAGIDTIRFRVTNSCGTATARYIVSVLAAKGVAEPTAITTATTVNVYPNPSNGMITVKANENITQVVVTDLTGKLVTEVVGNDAQMEVDLSSYASGTYLLRIATENGMQMVKVVKE